MKGLKTMVKVFKSRRFLFFLKVTFSIFIFSAAWRLAFLSAFLPRSPLPAEMGYAFFLGLKFDMRFAMLAFLPLLPFCIFPYFNLVKQGFLRGLSRLYLCLFFMLAFIFYALDIGHYAYLTRRTDVTVLNFLSNPDISGEMLWQSYPLLWIFFGFVLAALLIFYFVKLLHQGLKRKADNFTWQQKTLGFITGGVMLLLGAWQSLDQYPLRWSEAFFSDHHFVNALALNPVLYFADTYAFLDKEYDKQAAEKYYDVVSRYLNDQKDMLGPLDYSRKIPASSNNLNAPNIVMVLLETVPVNRFSTMGNPLAATPYLDQLGREGIFFEDFYVNIYGTARSVFTVLTGIPDVSRADTSSRNPMITKQNTLVNAFSKHEPYFMIGGSANWANIRGFIRHNIPHIKMFEADQFKSEKIDVWGITDYDLLQESHEIFEKRNADKPFFAFIVTAANHSPYTIPKHISDFQIDHEVDAELLEKAGYRSRDQYNAMRLLDHSIQAFMEKALASEYGKNTIFCFFGDHGTSSYRLDHMPAIEQNLGLTNFHVPLIIYAPDYLKDQGVVKGMASLPDVLPTLAGLAGIEYENKTFGKDVLSQSEAQRQTNAVLCVSFKEVKSKVFLLGKDFVLSMYRDQSNQKLFKRFSNEVKDVKADYPIKLQNQTVLAKGLYETAKYMLHHPE